MKTLRLVTLLAAAATASPALAESDTAAAAGEKLFKSCKACHSVVNGDEVIFKGGKTGPNLFGVIGRAAGSQEGFKYSKSLVAAGEAGLVWDAESLAAFVSNPKAFLRENLDDPKAKSKMSYKLKSGGDEIAAYLESVAQ